MCRLADNIKIYLVLIGHNYEENRELHGHDHGPNVLFVHGPLRHLAHDSHKHLSLGPLEYLAHGLHEN
jgi:hypothetical protein